MLWPCPVLQSTSASIDLCKLPAEERFEPKHPRSVRMSSFLVGPFNALRIGMVQSSSSYPASSRADNLQKTRGLVHVLFVSGPQPVYGESSIAVTARRMFCCFERKVRFSF
jgi:hypothetical protein